MTVKELIAFLETQDKNAPVGIAWEADLVRVLVFGESPELGKDHVRLYMGDSMHD